MKMDKKKKLTLGGIAIVIIGIAIALILNQCKNDQPSSSSSSENSSSEISSSSSESSSSSQSSSESSSSSQAVKHTVVFQNYDGSVIQSSELEEGATIVLPASAPTREDVADLGYAFVGYSGYTANMVVGNSDVTFIAEFELYSNAIGFVKNGAHTTVFELNDFSSNRLLIPSVAEGDPVTEIAADAASNQTTIDTVIIPTSITSIGANAFAGCSSIKYVFYLGSSTEWSQIAIASGNEALTDKVLFYSETQIAQGWHYVNEVPTLWDTPVYFTATLDATNAPSLSTTSFQNGSTVIDGFKMNYASAKSLSDNHCKLSGMSQGTLSNDSTTPITSIVAITVTFPTYAAGLTLKTGSSATALTLSQSLTSGVRVELPSNPSFFSIKAEMDMFSMDPMNAGATITSIVIEYTNIPVPAYPLYTLAEDEASYIVSSYAGNVIDLVIPTYFNGLPVTEIGDNAFKQCTTLKTIALPDSITKIGQYAFQGCTSLTGFDLPSNLVSIGNWAFAQCTSITYMHLPASVESIGEFCFAYSSALAEMTLAEGIKLTTITRYAFIYNVFSTIRLPEGITATGFDIFQSNNALTTVYFPLSLTTIGDSTFSNCANIKDIYYAGTEAQWNAVTKYSNFTYDIGSAVIHFAA